MNRRCRVEMYLDGVETGSEWLTRDEGRGAPADCSIGTRYEGGVTLFQASMRNVGTCRPDAKGEVQVTNITRARVPMRGTGAETLVVGRKAL